MREGYLHRIYIGLLVLITILTTFYLAYIGHSYYLSGIEDRFFHPDHQSLKPSGIIGHGLGIIGSLMMMIGVVGYMLRKRIIRLSRFGILKNWLEFHIFLCTMGPILVLYHTAFKFGGLVAISFWSMVAVVLSGVIGRYIYLQIPHTIEGREMNLNEINQTKDSLNQRLIVQFHLEQSALEGIVQAMKKRPDRSTNSLLKRSIAKYSFEHRMKREVRAILREQNISGKSFKAVMELIKSEINLSRKIDRLTTMKNLFKYWHVAHLPFALIMLIIMLVHATLVITFGYIWIF